MNWQVFYFNKKNRETDTDLMILKSSYQFILFFLIHL